MDHAGGSASMFLGGVCELENFHSASGSQSLPSVTPLPTRQVHLNKCKLGFILALISVKQHLSACGL